MIPRKFILSKNLLMKSNQLRISSSRFDFLINNDEISQQGCIIDNVAYYVSDSEFAQPTE